MVVADQSRNRNHRLLEDQYQDESEKKSAAQPEPLRELWSVAKLQVLQERRWKLPRRYRRLSDQSKGLSADR